MSTPLTFDPCMKTAVHGLVFTPALLCLQGVSPNIVTETLSASSPEVNSLQPGDLFDIELSKIDSSLGISVTVLFGKVSALSFFFSFVSPLLTLCVCVCVCVWCFCTLSPRSFLKLFAWLQFWESRFGSLHADFYRHLNLLLHKTVKLKNSRYSKV